MNRAFRHGGWLVAIVAASIFGCSTGSPPGGNGDSAAGASSSAVPGSAKGASSIKACGLLTADEIKTQMGMALDAGTLQTTHSQATCDWNGPEGSGVAVSITVEDFDESSWDFFAGRGKPVSGLGDGAVAGVPTTPSMMIKQGPYLITIGVVDFKISNDAQIADDEAFAALVLPRIAAG